MNETVYLGLGSNIGDRIAHMQWACKKLLEHKQIDQLVCSSVYESEAHVLDEGDSQAAYLNAVVSVQTNLSPEKLLRWINDLERERGRDRENEARWASRILDIDILAYGGHQIQSRQLQIPHRRLDQRKFVLLPWNEIAPEFKVPKPFDTTVQELLTQCQDDTSIHVVNHHNLKSD